MIKPWQSLRNITISTGSNPIKTIGKTITSDESIQNVKKLANNEAIETPNLIPIDNTILSVELPPSIPIYMKRGSLISIYGISNLSTSSIINQLEFQNVMKMFYGDFNFVYSKIISTSKISMLLTSNKKNWMNLSKVTNNKSLSVLILDGSTDWALLRKSFLQFYIGNSIKISNHLLPNTISKKLAKQQNISNSSKTGLPKWWNFSYTLLSGRGQLGITGKGSIYSINLVENEEILINKDNLLAITVNGSSDLQNCILDYSPNSPDSKSPESKALKTSNFASTSSPSFNKFVNKCLEIFGFITFRTKNYLIGNQRFIKVIGPRNLLIQSDINLKIPLVAKEDIQKPLKKFNSKSKDYLNYVNVDRSQTKITSTESFKDTLK